MVPALSGGERDSIRALVLGRNVEGVTACGEVVDVYCQSPRRGHSVLR